MKTLLKFAVTIWLALAAADLRATDEPIPSDPVDSVAAHHGKNDPQHRQKDSHAVSTVLLLIGAAFGGLAVARAYE